MLRQSLGGAVFAADLLAAPLALCSGLKITHEVALWRAFRAQHVDDDTGRPRGPAAKAPGQPHRNGRNEGKENAQAIRPGRPMHCRAQAQGGNA